MRRWLVNLVALLCGAALLPAGALAQVPKAAKPLGPGSLDGEVLSAKGAPVAGAQVLWNASDGETPHVLHSDAQGRFHIPRLRAGLYDFRASTSSAWSEWEHNVLVRPGGEASVKLHLVLSAPPKSHAIVLELKGTIRTWDLPVPDAMPSDPAADGKGNVWFTLQKTGTIARFNPGTKEWKLFKVPTPDSGPQGLVADAAGNLWFTENYAGAIGRLDAKTDAITESTAPTAKDPHTPVLGPDGALWFTAEKSNVIGRLDVTTGKITEYGVPTQNSHPAGMVSADDGALWFCESAAGRLGRVDPKTGLVTEFAPPKPEMHPRRLVAVGDAVYFTDFSGGRLGRLTLADKKFKFWDSPSGVDSQPDGIIADFTGNIWYEESAEKANKLVRFSPAVGTFISYPMPVENASVHNIARDARGHLWMPLPLSNKVMTVE